MVKTYFLLIFLISFLIFNLNFSFFYTTYKTGKGDTAPARLISFNILSGHGLYFDDFVTLYQQENSFPYFFQKFKNHYISSYPILTGLLALSIYLPFYFFSNHNLGNLYNLSFMAEKISSSFLAALNVALFFLLIYQLNKKLKKSLIFASILALATQIFSINSQFLWQHTAANLLLTASLLLLIKRGRLNFSLSLIFAILSFFSRYSFVIYAILLFLIIFYLDKKNIRLYLAILLSGLALLFAFNFYFYHSPFAGLAEPVELFKVGNGGLVLKQFLGIIFSPSRGLLFYTPIFILALASLFFYKKINKLSSTHKALFYLNYVYLVAVIAHVSFWGQWAGGHSFGDRLLADAAVPAVILSYFFYIFSSNFLPRLIFFVLIFYSVTVQTIGAFYYPKGSWDIYPSKNWQSRLWDWADNPIRRNLAVGPNLNGIYNFLNFIRKQDSKVYHGAETRCSLSINRIKTVLGYKILELTFGNLSTTDWITSSFNGPNLNLKQIFINKKTHLITESPIPVNNLPLIIRRGELVKVDMLVVPPDNQAYDLVIFPVQEQISFWNKSCYAKK